MLIICCSNLRATPENRLSPTKESILSIPSVENSKQEPVRLIDQQMFWNCSTPPSHICYIPPAPMADSGIASEWTSFGPDEVVSDGDVRFGSAGGGSTAGEILDHVD